MVLAGSFVEYLTDDEWKGLSRRGFRAAAAAALQWQAGMEPSFLPSPPSALTLWAAVTAAVTVTGSHGRNHSASWAGGREEESGEQGCGEAPHRSRSSSGGGGESAGSQAPFQRDEDRRPGGGHTGGAGAPVPTVCGGMDAAALQPGTSNNVGLL